MPEIETEVVIIGAGPVGACLAALLGSQGVNCVVIDAREENTQGRDGQADPRVLALTHASRRILQSFDLWRQLPQQRIGRFRCMHVWDENGKGEIRFDSADLCKQTLGYIVEQSQLQHHLDRILEYLPCVSVFRGASPKGLVWGKEWLTVTLDNQSFNARVVVAADGIHSWTRRFADIGYRLHDYKQQAVACTVTTALPHEQVARQRFLTNGPLAFLPLADSNRCGIVWSTSTHHARQLLDLDKENFNRVLQSSFANTLGEIIESGPRSCFPLQRAQAEHYCKERLVLAGDAAHSIHPLAGQGANLGLLDAASLGQVLLEARSRQKDIGNMRVLRRYERWRKGENRFMMVLCEGLKTLFETQTTPLPLLRNTGLDLVNSSSPVKHFIMRHAMGLAGDLPAIARVYG
ncbi:MAG: UbiH/UbiF/VisC/COQ6 family ubiquinone biosynthesis hydroxylase [Gammaproteobacteria bacterium]